MENYKVKLSTVKKENSELQSLLISIYDSSEKLASFEFKILYISENINFKLLEDMLLYYINEDVPEDILKSTEYIDELYIKIAEFFAFNSTDIILSEFFHHINEIYEPFIFEKYDINIIEQFVINLSKMNKKIYDQEYIYTFIVKLKDSSDEVKSSLFKIISKKIGKNINYNDYIIDILVNNYADYIEQWYELCFEDNEKYNKVYFLLKILQLKDIDNIMKNKILSENINDNSIIFLLRHLTDNQIRANRMIIQTLCEIPFSDQFIELLYKYLPEDLFEEIIKIHMQKIKLKIVKKEKQYES